MYDMQQHANRRHLWLAGVVILVTLLGLWLRTTYIRLVDLHVDEFTTLWAAQRILDTGVPLMPSGVFYSRGLVTSYLSAGAMALMGVSEFAGRLPSLLAGVAAIPVIFAVGRREWNGRVGLLAAVGLTLLPEAIDAAGRARFYAQLLLWVLLMLWAAYRTTRAPEAGWRDPLLMLVFFVLALFTQAETILLVPTMMLGLVLWNGVRVFRHVPVSVSVAGVFLAVAARYWVEQVGPVDSFMAVQTSKPYLGLVFAWQSAWNAYGHLFLDPPRLIWSIFAGFALLVACGQLWRARGRLRRLTHQHQASLYFALHLLWTWLAMATIVGQSWHDTRYILMVESCWLLLGAAGVVGLIDILVQMPAVRWGLTAGVAVAMALLIWPLTASALQTQTDGYQDAFAFVAQQRQSGDRIATPQPTACSWRLGTPCDYYARALDYQPYSVYGAGSELVDRWTGATVLRSSGDLRRALAEGGRLWLVTDRDRLASRYDSAYLQLILQQFDEVYSTGNTMVLLAHGLQATPLYTVDKSNDRIYRAGGMQLTDWAMTQPIPGTTMQVVLYWRQDGSLTDQVNTSLQLVAQDGTRVTQSDGPPARGWIRPEDFHEQPIPDFKALALPQDMDEGWYRLEIVAYDAASEEPLSDPEPVYWFQITTDESPPDHRLAQTWTDGITLTGISGVPPRLTPGRPLELELDWTTFRPPANDTTVFVHLAGPDDRLYAQHDKAPLDGFYPTSAWSVNQRVRDTYTLDVPDVLPNGSYTLSVGWYDPATGRRTPTEAGDDAYQVADWQLDSESVDSGQH